MTEEESIDRDRIIDGETVLSEYFCPICQYLLWKPHSCASCQQLFCEKCLRRWFENPDSGNRCPFRCEPYIDRRCPPYAQSLLSRLNIRCRNSSFGCSAILSYDTLEYHENVQCEYLTQRCLECEQLVLRSEFDRHQEWAGLCQPRPIKCTICQNYFEKPFFQAHFRQCCQQRINFLRTTTALYNDLQRMLVGQQAVPHNRFDLFENVVNTIELVEQQKRLSRFPTSLKGVDRVVQAREQNCGFFFHILIMLEFILLNWQKIPYFVFSFIHGGLVGLGIFILGVYGLFSYWLYTHIFCGSFLVVFLSCLSWYGTGKCLQYFSDFTVIFFLVTSLFLVICGSRVPLEVLEMEYLFNRPILCVVAACAELCLMKITMLLIRLYYWSMPPYLAAALLTLLHFCLGYKAYVAFANGLTANRNQPQMPV